MKKGGDRLSAEKNSGYFNLKLQESEQPRSKTEWKETGGLSYLPDSEAGKQTLAIKVS